jgi:ATP:corrinoid adenosyltransferase
MGFIAGYRTAEAEASAEIKWLQEAFEKVKRDLNQEKLSFLLCNIVFIDCSLKYLKIEIIKKHLKRPTENCTILVFMTAQSGCAKG